MSFAVDLYINKSDNNVINKNISGKTTVNGTLKESCTIINPEILLFNVTENSLVNINYCYISTFGRYYYVNNIEIVNNKLVKIICHCDVLMSFKEDILKCGGVIKRQETTANLLLSGADVPLLATTQRTQYKSSITFGTNSTLVLATVGKGPTS